MTQLGFYGVIFLTVVEAAQRLPEAASAGLQPAVATTIAEVALNGDEGDHQEDGEES